MFNHERLDKIFNLIYKDNNNYTTKTLALLLSVTERTIRSDVSKINDTLNRNGCSIELKRESGYFLTIFNPFKYQDFITSNKFLLSVDTSIYITPKQRMTYILKSLLLNNNYIKLESIEDELFISKTTLFNDFKVIKAILAKYNISICSKPYYGLKIQGSELDIRQCISDNLISRDFETYILDITQEELNIFQDIDLAKIHEIVISTIYNFNIICSDFNLKNLTIHIAIVLSRIKLGNVLTERFFACTQSIQMPILAAIINTLENDLNVIIPNYDRQYLYSHFVTKLNPSSNNTLSEIPAQQYALDLLNYIKANYFFNLEDDKFLLNDLTLHFQSTLTGKNYNLNTHNPLLDHIKINYPLAFEITLMATTTIFEDTSYVMTEDEVGYISLHIGAAIERYFDSSIMKKQIIIVCGSGKGSSRVLQTKINKLFSEKVIIQDCLSYNEYLLKDFVNTDLIISTIKLPCKNIPIIHVDFILTNKNIEDLSKAITQNNPKINFQLVEFFDKNLFLFYPSINSKDQLLSQMCDMLISNEIVPPEFKESVFEREVISPTNLDNFIAIPHPMELSAQQSKVCVAILKKPITWGTTHKVKVVFLLAINKSDISYIDSLYDLFLHLINDNSAQNDLINSNNYSKFIHLMYQLNTPLNK